MLGMKAAEKLEVAQADVVLQSASQVSAWEEMDAQVFEGKTLQESLLANEARLPQLTVEQATLTKILRQFERKAWLE